MSSKKKLLYVCRVYAGLYFASGKVALVPESRVLLEEAETTAWVYDEKMNLLYTFDNPKTSKLCLVWTGETREI